uniref:Photosystem II reaction center Psb28 protein n=1 Tax=Trieres chinensis TaxID=1514140 RepID=A0A7S2A8J2_TRICV
MSSTMTHRRKSPRLAAKAVLLLASLSMDASLGFSHNAALSGLRTTVTSRTARKAVSSEAAEDNSRAPNAGPASAIRSVAVASLLAASVVASLGAATLPAFADEYGRETEAPTLFTGETIMICKKRGPLGACLETVTRTADNDNDKATKYFRDPAPTLKERYATAAASEEAETEGSELIRKLRQQTEENREKNAQIVRTKTLLNDQSANFGPFDRQVVILNTDGQTFTLLQSAQAMRLKEAGYIKDRKFVEMPSKEVIEKALEGPDYGQMIKGVFGGGTD